MWKEHFNFWKHLWSKPEVEEVRTDPEPEVKHPHYIFIHGANQSKNSWNYVVSQLKPKSYTLLEYDTNKRFADNVEELYSHIAHLEDVIFVGHSLGGIYALHLYDRMPRRTLCGVTISSPYGGSKTADYVKYMVPSYTLFKEIGPRSLPITMSKMIKIDIPWTQIVTTRGSVPWHGKDNDGVVTVESMMDRDDTKYVHVAATHYEILVTEATVDTIKKEVECLEF